MSRIKELTARNEARALNAVVEQTAISKELVIRKLRENAERAEAIRGGSAVANRAWELIGKQLGMFQDAPPAGPPKLEDLSIEDLERLRLLGREPAAAGPASSTSTEELPPDLPPAAKPC